MKKEDDLKLHPEFDPQCYFNGFYLEPHRNKTYGQLAARVVRRIDKDYAQFEILDDEDIEDSKDIIDAREKAVELADEAPRFNQLNKETLEAFIYGWGVEFYVIFDLGTNRLISSAFSGWRDEDLNEVIPLQQGSKKDFDRGRLPSLSCYTNMAELKLSANDLEYLNPDRIYKP